MNAKLVMPFIQVVLKPSLGTDLITICAQRNYKKNIKITQESFHAHFGKESHNGESDWLVTLVDQADSTEELRRKESFWQYELNTF